MNADSRPAIDVALATYNGERHLPEFLESVRRQGWPTLRIVACDDGSRDDTVAVLRQTRGVPVDVTINPRNLGPIGNFSEALRRTAADYVVLADQDDVWMPDKLDVMMRRMLDVEAEHGRACPVAVFSDLRIVDGKLDPLAESFFDGTFKSRDAAQLRDFTITNHVPGCVMMLNRALIDLALPVPPGTFMHDWWLCYVAAGCGVVAHVDQPLILFRRHGGNFTGDGRAKLRGAWIAKTLHRLRSPAERVAVHWKWVNDSAQNANRRLFLLDQRYRDRLSPDARRQLDGLRSHSLRRRVAALRGGHLGESWNDALLIAFFMGTRRNRDVSGPMTSWN